MTPEDAGPLAGLATGAAEFQRRRRGRNIALLIVLVALAVIFYVVSIVKLAHA